MNTILSSLNSSRFSILLSILAIFIIVSFYNLNAQYAKNKNEINLKKNIGADDRGIKKILEIAHFEKNLIFHNWKLF